jgi:hypothetical protein
MCQLQPIRHCGVALARRIKRVTAFPFDDIRDSIAFYVSVSCQHLIRGSYDYRSRQAPTTIWSFYEGVARQSIQISRPLFNRESLFGRSQSRGNRKYAEKESFQKAPHLAASSELTGRTEIIPISSGPVSVRGNKIMLKTNKSSTIAMNSTYPVRVARQQNTLIKLDVVAAG